MENMTKEEFDKLYVGKAVHCYSESQSREFLKFAKEFRDVCKPVVEWLQKNASPMSKIIIEYGHAELVSGEIGEPYDIDD